MKNDYHKKILPIVLHQVVHDRIVDWEDVHIDILNKILNIMNCDSPTSLNFSQKKYKLLLTFDDGNLSDYDIVFPRLLEKNLNATFFVIVQKIGAKGYLNWRQIEEMHKYGMIIGSHSLSHKNMTELCKDESIKEFMNSKKTLEERLGEEITSFSYPYGECNPNLHKIGFDLGYKFLFTSKHGITDSGQSIIPRNAIHSRMNNNSIHSLLNPSLAKRFIWVSEDSAKSVLKIIFGGKRYKILKNKILKLPK